MTPASSTILIFLLCLSIQTSHSRGIITLIENAFITRSVINAPYEKITIDATAHNYSHFEYIFDEAVFDHNSPFISGNQLINATQWDLLIEIEMMVCYTGGLGDTYVLQTGFDATIFGVIHNMKQTEGYFTVYEVDCNDPSPTISNSECYLGNLDVYNVTDGGSGSEYFQIVFDIGNYCDCIGCNDTALFCRDVDVGGGWSPNGCEICYLQKEYEFIPGACPEPIISDLAECDAVSGSISVPYQSHFYDYLVNVTKYSTLTFSTCGSEMNTKVRIGYSYRGSTDDWWWVEHPRRGSHDWLDTDSCGEDEYGNLDSGEQFVLYPIDAYIPYKWWYNATLLRIQVRAFGTDTGNYNLAAICSNTAPPTSTSDSHEPPHANAILMNQTLSCGDSVQETLLDGHETHSYEVIIDGTSYMSVFFSTCDSATSTSLRYESDSHMLSDDNEQPMRCYSGDYDNEQRFATWSGDGEDIHGYVDVSAWESGDYVLDVVCQERNQISPQMNCGDVVHAYTDGSIDRYTLNVDASMYMGVYWFTCGSEIDTKLRVTDVNNNRIDMDSDYPCASGDTFMLGWIDDYDGSVINVDVISWDSGNYTLHMSCQEYSTIADINCGDSVVGNTLLSYGANYKFVNPVDQRVIFDICSVSDVVELTLYDSDWSNPRNQFFPSDNNEWRNNNTDCAHWVPSNEFGTNILSAGEYILRVERPVAFLFDVLCDEDYVFPDPRTSDLIGARCNYVQAYPDDEIWPIDECFVFAQPAENFTYSMHWLCDYDANGNVMSVFQYWYNQTEECNQYGQEPMGGSMYDPSQLFSFNCEAVDTCPFLHIQQFDDCNPYRDDPMDCIANNGYEAGGYIMDECFVVQTQGGFESVKRTCSAVSQSVIEMYYVGFDCTREYNYANATYDIAGFVENRLWLFDSCPTDAPIPQTTDIDTTIQTDMNATIQTTIQTDMNTTDIDTTIQTDMSTTIHTSETTDQTGMNTTIQTTDQSSETTVESSTTLQTTAAETTNNVIQLQATDTIIESTDIINMTISVETSDVSDGDPQSNSGSCQTAPFIFIVCVLRAILC